MAALTLPTTRSNGFKTIPGRFPSSLDRKVEDWIKFCLLTQHHPPLSRPLTIHLDALLDAEIDSTDLVSVSFQAFQSLIAQIESAEFSGYMPILRIPLEVSDTLIAGPVDAAALVLQIDHAEPPSLYLMERSFRTKMNAFEHYVCPLQAADFLQNTSGMHVYYSASRSLEDIEKGWEYARNIVAEYYPQAYRNTP